MPLTKAGRRALRKFIEEYGPEKGKQYFYAKENKDKAFSDAVAEKKKKTKSIPN